MSSAEDEFNDNDNTTSAIHESKKRRVQRACDICRRKKIRCDGSQMPGNRCSNCMSYHFECTYVEAAKKRGPPKGYVENLENRLEKMEKLLQRVCPDADFTQELGGGRIDRESWTKGTNGSSHVMSAPSSTYNGPSNEELVPSDDDDEMVTIRLSETLRNMNLNNPAQTRFFGKSSGVMLIRKAIDLKKEYTGEEEDAALQTENFYIRRRRPEFNGPFPWELAARNIKEPDYVFPEESVAVVLVDLYFSRVNSLFPLLHRPSFERKMQEGLHLRDSSFGSVYLLVCAVGSRFSDDPRVFLEGTNLEQSAGWKFFEQVQMVRKTLLGPPCLEDLQVYCLSVLFLQGTSAPQACWTMVGIGIRLAQDVGAHRRKVYSSQLTVEGELWKRAFWVLVSLDRAMSSSLGRPCAIQDEDFDLDLPVECDDEYWEHPDPDQAFKQPPDKPSTLSFFINFLKLYHILAFALRTIYSINKSKVLLGFVGQQWEQHIVAELDSALNKWIDAVPDHLRWDPNMNVNTPFFTQSCILYASYYHLQILIHRPFIPSPRKPSPLSFPSLAICTNAARSCSHIIDIHRTRSGLQVPFLLVPSFTAGIVLLLNIWGGKRSGLSTDPAKEMADVHKCMAVLKLCEKRWHTAGRLWDVLYELASVGDLPLPQPSPPSGTKRERDADSPSPTLHSTYSDSSQHNGPRTFAGSRRITRDAHAQLASRQQQQQQQHQRPLQPPQAPVKTVHPSAPATSSAPAASSLPAYGLPVYTNDLGRLPLHGQVGFSGGSVLMGEASSSSGMWYPSLSGGATAGAGATGAGTSRHATANGSGGGPQGYTHHHNSIPGAYPMDDLFYSQLASPFGPGGGRNNDGGSGSGSPFASSHHSLGGGATFTSTSTNSAGHGTDDDDFQALLDAASAGGTQTQYHIGQTGTGAMVPGMMDPDTIAMWSNAPTGFELNDWGTYITSVSGMTADGQRHGHGV